MKRETNTLDAEYTRRGLIRPTQYWKAGNLDQDYAADAHCGQIINFDWKGTRVWGARR